MYTFQFSYTKSYASKSTRVRIRALTEREARETLKSIVIADEYERVIHLDEITEE